MKRSLLFLSFLIILLPFSVFAEVVHTLAVLDFQNNTGMATLDNLMTGIPQMLVTELSSSGSIKVVERQRLEQALKELALEQSGVVGTESALQIGKMLGAEVIIAGSYIKAGNSFRIDAHLIDVTTGEVIGEKVLGASVNDVMRLVSELAGKINNRVLKPEAGKSAATGSLAITADPANVLVFLDETLMGATPISLQGIKIGPHKVSFFLNGYYPLEQQSQVKAGQIEIVNVALKEIEPENGGGLALSSKPADAMVTLDGLPLGSTPLSLSKLLVGEHTLTLGKEGFNPWEAVLTIQPGKVTTRHVILSVEGEVGSLAVTTTPAGSQVFLNGFSRGVTPLSLSDVPAGEYQLKLVTKDYEDALNTITVNKGEVTTVSEQLVFASEENKARVRMQKSALAKLDYIVFGLKGKKWGDFYSPANLAADSEGNIHVADYLNHRVQKFDTHGVFLNNIGAARNDFNLTDAGKTPGLYYKPADVTLGPAGEIYVVDSLNNRIQKFSADNQFLAEWGQKETSELGYYTGRLSEPRGIGIDNEGNVYVADYGNDRVQKFTDKGKHLFTLGGKKTANPRLFKKVVDVAVDPKLNVWVVDQGTSQVFKLDQQGKLLQTLGKAKASRAERIQSGNFYEPQGIAIDQVGNVYVADCANHRVQIFDNDGKYLGALGINADTNKNNTLEKGYKEQEFNYPTGVAVDAAGNIYVADMDNNRVHRFPPRLIKKP